MKPITDLYGSRLGQDAIVLGKGPSLEGFVPDQGPLLVALNHAALLYDADYAIALDHQAPDAGYPPELSPRTLVIRRRANLVPGERVDFVIDFDGDVPANLSCSSSATALWLLHRMGILRVLLVGFDSWTWPADVEFCPSLKEYQCIRYPGWYDKNNVVIEKAIKSTGMKVFWHHLKEAMPPAAG